MFLVIGQLLLQINDIVYLPFPLPIYLLLLLVAARGEDLRSHRQAGSGDGDAGRLQPVDFDLAGVAAVQRAYAGGRTGEDQITR